MKKYDHLFLKSLGRRSISFNVSLLKRVQSRKIKFRNTEVDHLKWRI